MTTTATATRLQKIETRQRKSFARDLLFSALVVIASVVSISSVGTAVNAAHPQIAAR